MNIVRKSFPKRGRNYRNIKMPPQLPYIRGERIVFWWPNTNKNIIQFPKNDQIRIQIFYGLPKMTKYKYEYYSVSQKWPNTNTNIIRFPKNNRIRVLFGYPEMTEYEYKYHFTSQKSLNSINKYKFCWSSKKEGLQYQFWVSQGFMLNSPSPPMTEGWSQLQMQTASNPYDTVS